MATQNNLNSAATLSFLLIFGWVAAFVPVEASPEGTKTVEFNVKPGGVVHTFTEAIVSDSLLYFPEFYTSS